jgi:serine/threonine protein kinase HipA of HipAB toxin-antitoxin module
MCAFCSNSDKKWIPTDAMVATINLNYNWGTNIVTTEAIVFNQVFQLQLEKKVKWSVTNAMGKLQR